MSISAEQTNTLQQTPQTKKQMLNYINVFRGFAILAIVAIHTLLFSHNTSFQSAISAELLGSGSVFFVFISGFLFQHLAYKFEYQTYLSKKWNNVICPYLITSILSVLLHRILSQSADMVHTDDGGVLYSCSCVVVSWEKRLVVQINSAAVVDDAACSTTWREQSLYCCVFFSSLFISLCDGNVFCSEQG